jgi:integrase
MASNAKRVRSKSAGNVVAERPHKEAGISLMTFFEEQYIPLRLRTRSARTVTLYRSSIRTFAKFLGRDPELSDLTDLTVSRHLMKLRERGLAAHSIEKERCQLLAIWRFACRKGHVQIWPDVPAEAKPDRVPQAWTQDELRRLFDAIRQEPGKIAGVTAADWWRVLHLLAWDTGERITALMSLRWAWLNPADRTVMVPAEVRKGRRKDRLFQLAPDTVAAIEAIRLPKRALVLPWPYAPTYLWKRYEPILKRAGLPCDRRSKFHRMRRSVASHFEVAGGNATELLGHSTRRVTLEHYLDPRIVKPKQAAELLFRPSLLGSDEQTLAGE